MSILEGLGERVPEPNNAPTAVRVKILKKHVEFYLEERKKRMEFYLEEPKWLAEAVQEYEKQLQEGEACTMKASQELATEPDAEEMGELDQQLITTHSLRPSQIDTTLMPRTDRNGLDTASAQAQTNWAFLEPLESSWPKVKSFFSKSWS